MTPQIEHVPVLIVGAGPAGLIAAATLARYGIDALLVERRTAPSNLPRATGVSTWSMELLRSWGLEDEVRAGGIDVEWSGWMAETLQSAGTAIPLGLPTREQSAAISPTGPACVPQDHLEPVLRRHVAHVGGRIELGTEVLGFASRHDGIDAVVRDRTGRSRTVRARYAIAADGAHSAVRTTLGVPMRGPGTVVEAVSIVFRAPIWRLLGERRHVIYPITHPDVAGTFVPCGRDDRWLYGVTRAPGELDASAFDATEMIRRIRIGAADPTLDPQVERIGTFTYTAQLADRFRDGSTFLVGDAAHRVTPRGGTGMNTAIRDGYDIAWKLAWVMSGWAGPELLDTYEAERRPVAEHNVARSAEPNGSIRPVTDAMHVDLGGRIAHLWVDSEPGRPSTLDLVGPAFTRFVGPDATTTAEAADGGAPVAVRRLPAMVARALGILDGGSLLVRPDAVPARG